MYASHSSCECCVTFPFTLGALPVQTRTGASAAYIALFVLCGLQIHKHLNSRNLLPVAACFGPPLYSIRIDPSESEINLRTPPFNPATISVGWPHEYPPSSKTHNKVLAPRPNSSSTSPNNSELPRPPMFLPILSKSFTIVVSSFPLTLPRCQRTSSLPWRNTTRHRSSRSCHSPSTTGPRSSFSVNPIPNKFWRCQWRATLWVKRHPRHGSRFGGSAHWMRCDRIRNLLCKMKLFRAIVPSDPTFHSDRTLCDGPRDWWTTRIAIGYLVLPHGNSPGPCRPMRRNDVCTCPSAQILLGCTQR